MDHDGLTTVGCIINTKTLFDKVQVLSTAKLWKLTYKESTTTVFYSLPIQKKLKFLVSCLQAKW